VERVAEVRAGGHPNGSQAAEQIEASPRGLVRPELDRNDQAIAAAILRHQIGDFRRPVRGLLGDPRSRDEMIPGNRRAGLVNRRAARRRPSLSPSATPDQARRAAARAHAGVALAFAVLGGRFGPLPRPASRSPARGRSGRTRRALDGTRPSC